MRGWMLHNCGITASKNIIECLKREKRRKNRLR
jgi:hypothetical protein